MQLDALRRLSALSAVFPSTASLFLSPDLCPPTDLTCGDVSRAHALSHVPHGMQVAPEREVLPRSRRPAPPSSALPALGVVVGAVSALACAAPLWTIAFFISSWPAAIPAPSIDKPWQRLLPPSRRRPVRGAWAGVPAPCIVASAAAVVPLAALGLGVLLAFGFAAMGGAAARPSRLRPLAALLLVPRLRTTRLRFARSGHHRR